MTSAVTGSAELAGPRQVLEGEGRAQVTEVQAAVLVARHFERPGDVGALGDGRDATQRPSLAETAPSCMTPAPCSESSCACTATKRSVTLAYCSARRRSWAFFNRHGRRR